MLSRIIESGQFSIDEVRSRRCQVARQLMAESDAIRDINFRTINTRDLFELFSAYDDQFFEGQLSRFFDHRDHVLRFRLSKRMTSTGGMTTYYHSGSPGATGGSASQRHFEIAVSATLLFNTSFEGRPIKVGGVATPHRLDALQRIFEHELVHLLEMVLWRDSSCARPRFRGIVNRFFGHTESNHQLLTPAETARSRYGIAPGDAVHFLHQGARLKGFVNRINRRATVLVPDPLRGEMFDDNQRYRRFYVPLERLTKVVAVS